MTVNWGYAEQLEAHQRIVDSRGGIVWWKAGTGKTRIGIEWFESMRSIYKLEFPCICLVVIKRSAFLDFRKEVQKLDYDCVIMEDNLFMPREVELATLQKPTLLLVSAAMLTKSVDRVLVDPRIKMAIVDELYLYKNPKAQRSKAIHKLSAGMCCAGLSGSIMTAQDLVDVYGQLMAVNKHRYVAANLTSFRSKFMNMKMNEKRDGTKYPFRYPKPGAYRQIMELCKECTHVYFPEQDQRKITSQILSVPATPQQIAAFADLRKWMEVELDGKIIEYNNKLEVALRIQQIANGWVVDDDRVVRRIKSNKPEFLIEKIKEVTAGGDRAVVWCAFKQDVRELHMLTHAHCIPTVLFTGEDKFNVERWESGEARVCLATEAMGVSVNHFEQTPYAFYFSQNYRWTDLQQSMARTNRYSSLHPEAFYYFLQVEGSLDSQIFCNVASSRDWEQRLINIGEELTKWQRT